MAYNRSNERIGRWWVMGSSQLTHMSPKKALLTLTPGVGALICVGAAYYFDGPPLLILTASIVGFVPSAVIVGWGTLKFRSYYEVKRTRSDLWTMFYATVIQLLAMTVCAILFIAALDSYELLGAWT